MLPRNEYAYVPVFQVVYFQMKKPLGYVIHERTSSNLQTVMISIGPFFVNTVLGTLIALLGYLIVGLIYIGALGSFFWLDLLYGIGVAVGIPKLIVALMS